MTMPARLATLLVLPLLLPRAGEPQDFLTLPEILPASAGHRALPFAAGERIEFDVRVARVGATGTAQMSVEGPVDVRGTPTLKLHFDFRAALGPLSASDCSISWIDPSRFVSLRFHKKERHLLARGEESLELYPDEGRRVGVDGESREMGTSVPLDELSFIYFLRTLAFDADSTLELARHYEAGRNPVRVRMLGRDTVQTPLGMIPVIQLEMRVRDPRRYGRGEGVIRLDLSDDARRLPVRMESEMPLVGRAVMTLRAVAGAFPSMAGIPLSGNP